MKVCTDIEYVETLIAEIGLYKWFCVVDQP
jgi:hypothetical protein